jgi:hypothetical protein
MIPMRLGVLLSLTVAMLSPLAARAAEPDWRTAVRTYAAEHFKHPAWGYSHHIRDYQLARTLAEADHATIDDDVLFAAAYLHDMGGFDPWDKQKGDHADIGADGVAQVLKDTGFPMAKLDAVRAAIRTHMYGRDPAGPEAQYLHDADALDWLGAIGVARMIALADPSGKPPTVPDAIKSIEHLATAVPARVVTPAGRAQIAPRLAETRQFLDELSRESDGYRAL